jgi:alpha-tubulin suppressor-like RCC1 family protein
MAELRQNTWSLDEWYDQHVAGNVEYNFSGKFWYCGYSWEGQWGSNQPVNYRRSSPVLLGGPSEWKEIFGGSTSNAVFGIKTDNSGWCWGSNRFGNLGIHQPNNGDRSSPVQLPGSWKSFTSIGGPDGEGGGVMAIKQDGTAWAWGTGKDGRLALNSPNDQRFSSPNQIGTDTNWGDISFGASGASYGTKTDGTMWVWGRNNYGGLGLNSSDNDQRFSSPVQLPGTNWAFGRHSCTGGEKMGAAVKQDGTLWTWGLGDGGAPGLNDQTTRSSPTQVGTDTNWQRVTALTGHNPNLARFCSGMKTDGTLWVWGNSAAGALGNNEGPGNNRSSPLQVPGTWKTDGYNVVSVATDNGAIMSCVKADGTLWGWGGNYDGQLGTNESAYPQRFYSSPTQCGTATHWMKATQVCGYNKPTGIFISE